jgi:hypothetical protein
MWLLIVAALVVTPLVELLRPAHRERQRLREAEARHDRAHALLTEHEAKREQEAKKRELYEKRMPKLPMSL